jgi:transcriptional regulator with XRE-family HTH domain
MNFQRLIKKLVSAGWTQAEIAKKVGCSQANIARLLKDKEAQPKYSVGAALVELAGEVC